MAYPPQVERWRPTVAKYFRPEDVDKALWVIQWESGGQIDAANYDGESSLGLFQMNQHGGLGQGYSAETLMDPEANIRIAAQAVYGGSGWQPWNENRTPRSDGAMWGALGNHPYPGGSGGGGSAMASNPALDALRKQLADLIAQGPPSAEDPHEDALLKQAYDERVRSMQASIASMEAGLGGGTSGETPNAIATQDFTNRMQGWQAGLAYDNTSLARAIADIDRYISGQAESRGRADLNLKGQDMIRQYGTSLGKKSFSLDDLGSGFAAAGARSGLDPSKGFINYSGTMTVDPAADMARYDAAAGVTGTIPVVPPMRTSFDAIPGAPGLGSPPAPYGGGGVETYSTGGRTTAPPPSVAGIDPTGAASGGGIPIGAAMNARAATAPVSLSGTIPIGMPGLDLGGLNTETPEQRRARLGY